MNLRNQYLYQLKGTLHGQQLRKKPHKDQPFYQVNITCENLPAVQKIYVFENKVSAEIWQALEKNQGYGQRYLFFCQNYRGYYNLIDWEELPHHGNGTIKAKKCQYQARGCQKLATYQHILKLGAVQVDKKWVCTNCKQILIAKEYDQ